MRHIGISPSVARYMRDMQLGLDNSTSEEKRSEGWVCPQCGRGNAPWRAECGCHREGRGVDNGTANTGNWELGQ